MKHIILTAILGLGVMSTATPAYAQNFENISPAPDAAAITLDKTPLKRRVIKVDVKPAPQKTATQSRSVIFDQRVQASKMHVVRPQTTPIKMPNLYKN